MNAYIHIIAKARCVRDSMSGKMPLIFSFCDVIIIDSIDSIYNFKNFLDIT